MSSRKPETPRDDGPAGTGRDLSDIDTGARFVARDSELWQIEQELADAGELPADANRAVPLCDHPEHGDTLDAAEIRERIERETERENPNQTRIGHLNGRLAEVTSDVL
jgi:hypothetical protein